MNKSYYAIITADVRYNKNLPDGAKLLFGEITALCNERGYCWANNSYFAELYSKSNNTISRWIGILNKENLIELESNKEDGNARKIYLTSTQKQCDPITKNGDTYHQKSKDPITKNGEHNNTVNNTNNKLIVATAILSKKVEEYKQANPKKYTDEMYKSFLDYWTEENSKGKQRWEKQEFFELGKRLATWKAKQDTFQNKFSTPQKPKGLVM